SSIAEATSLSFTPSTLRGSAPMATSDAAPSGCERREHPSVDADVQAVIAVAHQLERVVRRQRLPARAPDPVAANACHVGADTKLPLLERQLMEPAVDGLVDFVINECQHRRVL